MDHSLPLVLWAVFGTQVFCFALMYILYVFWGSFFYPPVGPRLTEIKQCLADLGREGVLLEGSTGYSQQGMLLTVFTVVEGRCWLFLMENGCKA